MAFQLLQMVSKLTTTLFFLSYYFHPKRQVTFLSCIQRFNFLNYVS